MKFLQAYYTSCKVGQSSAPGFQYYAYSIGCLEDELNEIERITVYNKPIGMESDYPLSLQFKALDSGRYILASTKYIGQDYAGSRNEGNRFSHALILDNKSINFNPAVLISLIQFKEELSNEEANTPTKPQALPIVELNQSIDSTKLLHNISNKISENDAFSSKLRFIINAIIDSKDSNRKVLIADNTPNILTLTQALSFCLPLEVFKNISFKTYAKDPSREDYDIVGTSPEGSSFDFNNDIMMNHQFYAFNTQTNKISTNIQTFKFTDFVLNNYQYNVSNLNKFKDFINTYFDYKNINKDIDALVSLFLLKDNPIPPDCQTYNHILSTINKYAKKTKRDELFKLLSLQQIFSLWSTQDEVKQTIEQLANTATKTNNAAIKKEIFLFWLTSWSNTYDFQQQNDDTTEQIIEEQWSKYRKFGVAFSDIFDDVQVQSLLQPVGQHTTLYLSSILNIANSSDLTRLINHNENFNKLINSMSQNQQLAFCDKLPIKNNVLQIITRLLYGNNKNPSFRDNLIENIYQISERKDILEDVEHYYSSQKDYEIFFKLLSLKFSKSKNQSKTFWSTYNQHFENGQIGVEYFKPFVSKYIAQSKSLKEDEVEKILGISLKIKDSVLLDDVANRYEQFVTFSDPDHDKREKKRVKKLIEISKQTNVITDKKSYKLLEYIYQFVDNEGMSASQFFNDQNSIKSFFGNLDKIEIIKLHEWLLTLAVERTDSQKDIKATYTYISGTGNTQLKEIYEDALIDMFKYNSYRGDHLKYYLKYSFENNSNTKTFDSVLVKKISKLSPSKIENLIKHYSRVFSRSKKEREHAKILMGRALKLSQNKFSQKIIRSFTGLFSNKKD